MSQLTLVAHYGPKKRSSQAPFMAYVHACQEAMGRSTLGGYFAPYEDAQIHGTLIGLERVTDPRVAAPSTRYNANLWQRRGELRAMDLDCALRLARALPPMTIRFGGFRSVDQVIESRGQSAHARSFGIDWRTGKVVIIGWVHEDGDLSGYAKLWAVRQTFAERCHVHHKYEADSDFFVVIGELDGLEGLDEAALTALQDAGERVAEGIRASLADPRRAVDLSLRVEDLSVVRYANESLDLAGSQAFPVIAPDLDATAF